MNKMKPAYKYQAEYVRNYDGDTVRVNISLGFGVWLRNQSVRLLGIDTPEIRGSSRAEGLKSKKFTADLMSEAKDIIIETKKDKKGKYGRWLATIWVCGEKEKYVNLNEELVNKGFAIHKEY